MLGTRQASARKGNRYARTAHIGIRAAGECSAHKGIVKVIGGEYWRSTTPYVAYVSQITQFSRWKRRSLLFIFALLLKLKEPSWKSAAIKSNLAPSVSPGDG